jgi:hypothetical protein
VLCKEQLKRKNKINIYMPEAVKRHQQQLQKKVNFVRSHFDD